MGSVPARPPPVGIAVVLGEAEFSQWPAALGVEPVEAGGRRRPIDPRRQVERRAIAPFPQVAPERRLAGQPGALLDAPAVSLLGDPSHQLQHVPLVAIREVAEPPLRNPLATSFMAPPSLSPAPCVLIYLPQSVREESQDSSTAAPSRTAIRMRSVSWDECGSRAAPGATAHRDRPPGDGRSLTTSTTSRASSML